MAHERRSGEPVDRLTGICDEMITVLEANEREGETIHCVVLLDDGKAGGLVMHGYDDDRDAVVDILVHLRAIMRANGMDLKAMLEDDAAVSGPDLLGGVS